MLWNKPTGKKGEHNSRIFNLEKGSFETLVSSIIGGIGKACSIFIEKVSQLVSREVEEESSTVTCDIRCKWIYFLSRSFLIYVRGSRKSNEEYDSVNEIKFRAIELEKGSNIWKHNELAQLIKKIQMLYDAYIDTHIIIHALHSILYSTLV